MFPKGDTEPTGFEKLRSYLLAAGSVVKFRPEGGAVLGRGTESKDADAPTLQTSNRLTIEGGLAMYPGLAPFSSALYGNGMASCSCRGPRFDLDRYGRLVLPNAFSNSVTVMDNAGNVILRVWQVRQFRLTIRAARRHGRQAAHRHARHSAGLAGRSGFHRKGHLRCG